MFCYNQAFPTETNPEKPEAKCVEKSHNLKISLRKKHINNPGKLQRKNKQYNLLPRIATKRNWRKYLCSISCETPAGDQRWDWIRNRLRQDSACFFRTQTGVKHLGKPKPKTWSHFSISAVVGVCVVIRDEWTMKFFSPSPVLIRWNWIRSSPDPQNFWKSSVRSSPDPPM